MLYLFNESQSNDVHAEMYPSFRCI